jgi:hypothetical protein
MNGITEVYDGYKSIGINPRKITKGIEFDLVKEFIQFKKEKFKPTSNKNLMIFIEPNINHTYPDIVFVEYKPEGFDNWSHFRFELTKVDYKICYFIH